MKTMMRFIKYISMFGLMLAVVSCQGRPSENPPIHLNPNMDYQPKYVPQGESHFFIDGSMMRHPVEGTVAIGQLRESSEFYTGKSASGGEVTGFPVEVVTQISQLGKENFVKRGQNRYGIYCSPCHGALGNGQGIVVKRGMFQPPDFQSANVRSFTNGYLFGVMTNGVRNMPTYRHQISVMDRWAVVSYLRALQRSQNATLNDVPEDKRSSLQSGS